MITGELCNIVTNQIKSMSVDDRDQKPVLLSNQTNIITY